MNHDDLVRTLIQYVAAGKLDPRLVQPVLRNLGASDQDLPPSGELLDALAALGDPETAALAEHLRDRRRTEAASVQGFKSRGQPVPDALKESLRDLPLGGPVGWGPRDNAYSRIQAALRIIADRFFFLPHREKAPRLADELEKRYQAAVDAAFQNSTAWGDATLRTLLAEATRQEKASPELTKALGALGEAVDQRRTEAAQAAERALSTPDEPPPAGLDEDLFLDKAKTWLAQAQTPEERRRLLDLLCTWPNDRVAPVLADLDLDPAAADRASMILTLRFGNSTNATWDAWRRWLKGQIGLKNMAGEGSRVIVRKRPLAMLYLWYSRQPGRDSDLLAALERLVADRLDPVTMDSFVDRWARSIPTGEWMALTGADVTAAPLPPILPIPRPTEVKPKAPPPPVPKPPPKPSVWEVHLRPFFLENWYMVAGVMMVLVGASLLAYYTWDKSPLVRYTLMPALLGGFTMALAWMGSWIERRDAQFKATAAVLRGTAISLLPVNFMAIALLAEDRTVTHPGLFVPLMSGIYLLVFGWGLWRWCSGVHERIGVLLGGTLLFINSLVAVAPLSRIIAGPDADIMPIVGTGFYLGFAALAVAVWRFAHSVLTLDLSKEKRVVWFFGASLAITFLQVFAWVHGYLKHLPHVYTYAPMVVLTGGLVLVLERRTLELRGEEEKHGSESFLGFAFILLGVLMGIGHDDLRIATFALAGVVWIACTMGRRHPLHAWIGLTLVTLGGASVGLLEGFPPAWRPSLGIALALGLGITGLLVRSSDLLRTAAAGMQAAVLILTVLVTMLSRTQPYLAAGHLAAVAALFGVRAWRDQKIRWAQTAMVVLALALPYLAGVDVHRQALHSTIIVGGLAVLGLLWIGGTLSVKSPVLTGARSTVLWIYGVLAIACMAMRVTIDEAAANDLIWADLGGPLLMCAVLVWAAWFSRSLIPSLMAMLIGLILLPEFKERMMAQFPQLAWGSGLGSAAAACVLTIVSFRLRTHPALQKLEAGDKYLGVTPYPLLRHDFTLFTWPMVASAFFLTVKVETWNLFANLDHGADMIRPAAAVVVSGLSWLLLAVYHRHSKFARVATYLGLVAVGVGTAFLIPAIKDSVHPATLLLIVGLALQGLFFVFRFGLQPRAAWAVDLLTTPARRMLKIVSVFFAGICLLAYAFDRPREELQLLTGFTAIELAWHGLTSRRRRYGAVLYVLDWVALASWASHQAPTGAASEGAILASLGLVIAMQVFQAALEFRRAWYELVKPLFLPFQAIASFKAAAYGVLALSSNFDGATFTPVMYALSVIALLLSARALSFGPLALLAVLVGYFSLHASVPGNLSPELNLMTPWHASLLALAMAVFGAVGKRIHAIQPRALSGAYTPKTMNWPASPWMHVPAVLVSVAIGFYQIGLLNWWPRPEQVWAPYLSAVTISVVAFSTGYVLIHHLAGVFLSLGNIHLIFTFWGAALREKGISDVHLVALGIAFTLLQGSLLRRVLRRDAVTRLVNQSSLAWAGLVLLLISANYLVHPNLAEITWQRFAISGGMSFLAGWYFRRAARHPQPGEEPFAIYGEGFYHFGVTMAFWCGALMVPALRTPITALVALGVPVLYFYARAEFGWRRATETYERYRASAATLGFVVLGLYALRGVVQMAVFPDVPFDTDYYHANSPVIFVLGVILLRLQALGGTSWLSFYGGLAVMGSTYFALTALPGLSPFKNPVASAWAALGLAHFYTLASLQRSPLRTAIQRLAAIDANQWQELRRPWGVCLLVAAHGMVFWGCLDHVAQPRMVAPLIVGAASLLIHQGILRQSRLYPILAQIEIVAALHAGFLVHSYLQPQQVVWALLGLWAAMLAIEPWLRRVLPWTPGHHVQILCYLVAGHVWYHGPSSATGLWAFGLAAALLALTPIASREPSVHLIVAALLPFAPAWLVWFSQVTRLQPGEQSWHYLSTTAAVYAVGVLAAFLKQGFAEAYLRHATLRPRLYDQAILWMGALGRSIHSTLLWLAFLATAIVQGLHWGAPFSVREVVVIEMLFAAFAVAAWFEGQARKKAELYYLLELCVLGAFLVARQQLHLTRHLWQYEYDVWASLTAFFAFVGLRQLLEKQPREVQIPLHTALLALPAFSVAWIFLHHLGTDLGLVAIGLHSAAFTYLGKDDRESPYHLVAVGGFVGFVLLLFVSKLHLSMLYAYVVPVGLGVLVLLQLFKQRVPAEARQVVRTVVLVSMIGSAGWSALMDPKVPLLHNLAVMVLCLGSMALGGFLRIRLYVGLGFGALMLDLVVIFVKAVSFMDRTARMTIVGSSVLLLGASLVFGAIYYKTHKQQIGAVLERWRLKFAGWE